MCGDSKCCKRQAEQVREPKECSPEQIRECHGGDSEHACVSECKPCAPEAEAK